MSAIANNIEDIDSDSEMASNTPKEETKEDEKPNLASPSKRAKTSN
jgi:hypothetical protein